MLACQPIADKVKVFENFRFAYFSALNRLWSIALWAGLVGLYPISLFRWGGCLLLARAFLNFIVGLKNDLDRRWRYGRSVTDERIPDNLPSSEPRFRAELPRAKSFLQPRQNDLPISDAFLTTSRITSHNHASPTESRDAPMPAESTIGAPSTIRKQGRRGWDSNPR